MCWQETFVDMKSFLCRLADHAVRRRMDLAFRHDFLGPASACRRLAKLIDNGAEAFLWALPVPIAEQCPKAEQSYCYTAQHIEGFVDALGVHAHDVGQRSKHSLINNS
jgi:hypothetical protein